MIDADRSLMGAQQPAFEEGYDTMHSGKQIDCGFPALFEENDPMVVAAGLEPIIAKPSVGSDRSARFNTFLNKSLEAVGRCIWHTAHTDAPQPVTSYLLDCHHNQQLIEGLATANPFLGTPVRLVDLNGSVKALPSGPHHRPSQFVQPTSSRLIAPQPEDLFQPKSTGPVLLARYPPHRSEPGGQRRSRILENCPRGDRGLATTGSALHQSPDEPGFTVAALWTAESVGPSEQAEIFPTGIVGGKTLFEFGQRLGIVLHGPEHYILGLPESSGYPAISRSVPKSRIRLRGSGV